jgi:membrane protease subunit HflK
MSDKVPGNEPDGNQAPRGTERPSIALSLVWIWDRIKVIYSRVVRLFTAERNTVLQDIKQAFKHLNPMRISYGIVLGACILYAVSGIYTVQPGENAVVVTLGAISEAAVPEGIHYRLPWPFARVSKVNVSEVRREIVGLEQAEPDHPEHPEGLDRIQVLSGDTNIIDYVAIVQYKVKDPTKYLFSVNVAPYRLIRNAIRTAITNKSALLPVDDILTTKRQSMQTEIRNDIQALMDSYGSGVSIVTVNFQKAYPPDEVADAFQDVQSAKEDKEKMINQALGYQNSLIPEARGTAERSLIEAQAYAQSVMDTANGASMGFDKILSQFRSDRLIYGEDVTRFRLYLETMERVIKRVNTYVVEKDGKIDLRMVDAMQKIRMSESTMGIGER